MKTEKKMLPLLQMKVLLLCLWIFTAPTNLFWKILPNFGFVGGLQIDYLIPKLYLSELVGIVIIGAWLFEQIRAGNVWSKAKTNINSWSLALAACLVLLFVRQFFTSVPISAVWFFISSLLHVVTLWIALSWVKQNSSQNLKKILIVTLACTVLFQSVLGLYQFVHQRQFVGFLFFGEPQLTRDIGLSKGDFALADQLLGTQLGLRILPYGTTPHPNVLAGFLAISTVVLLASWLEGSLKRTERIFVCVCVASSLIIIFLTLSVSAWLVLCLGTVLIFLEKSVMKKELKKTHLKIAICAVATSTLLLLPIVLHTLNVFSGQISPSLFRRDFLNQFAVTLFEKNPVVGIGMNQFTVEVAQASQNQLETVSFVQPAHHIPLLFVTENGLLGLVILFLFYKLIRKDLAHPFWQYVCVLIPIIGMDHYFYSITSGQSIFAIGLLFWLL